MSVATPSVTMLAPVDAIPKLTSGRNSSGYGSGHEPKYTLDNDPDTWWEPDWYVTSSIYYDLSVTTSVDAVTFWLHNYNENYENTKAWRVSYSDDDITYTALTIKEFNDYRTSYTPIVIDTLTGGPISARYWRIEFLYFAIVPQTIIPEISCVWFMQDYSLPWKHQKPESNKLLYHNNESVTRSGHRFASNAGRGRQRRIQRGFIFTGETSQWANLVDAYTAAQGQNLPIVLQTELGSSEYYAMTFDAPLSENRQGHELWQPTVALRELGHERIPYQDYRLHELAETVAIWRFRQNGDDDTDNGHDFTNTGYVDADYENGHAEQGVTVLRAQAANSLSMTHGQSSALDMGTGSFTIEAWVLLRSTMSGSDRSFIGKVSGWPPKGWVLTIDALGKFGMSIGNGIVGGFWGGTVAVNDNQWHLQTVVCDRSANLLKFYVDGVFTNSQNIVATAGANFDNTGVGAALGSIVQDDVVWWDEICVTKRLLTPTEILNRYTGKVAYGSWGM